MILTQLQNSFLKSFFKSYLGQFFFLSGGTALAEFYLRHRLSQDIDLFTIDQKLQFDQVNAEVIKVANNLKLTIEHQVISPTFLQYIFKHNNDTLKVDIVKDVPIHFGKIKTVQGIRVDSLANIAIGKLLAVFGRADAKDFVDLYFLFKIKKLSFKKLFSQARQKDLGLDEFYLGHMLQNVQRIQIFPPVLKPFNETACVNFFLNLSQTLFKKIKPKE